LRIGLLSQERGSGYLSRITMLGRTQSYERNKELLSVRRQVAKKIRRVRSVVFLRLHQGPGKRLVKK